MNMLALLTDAYGGYGGIAQYNRDLLEALAARDDIRAIDVAVRVAPLALSKLDRKIRQHSAISSRIQYTLVSASLSLVRRPQLIFNGHLYHGPLAASLARLTGARLISQLHGSEVWGGISPKHLAPLKQSDLVLCVSRDTQRRLLAICPELNARTAVVPNMVGSAFHPGDRDSARRRFGLQNEKVILTVARLDGRRGYKGHDRIISMLPGLTNEFGGAVRYYIAGQGEDRARLEQLARDLGVADATVFLGRVETDLLPDLYRAADLFAMPSTGEGFGIVYLEAMACGTPAIGLDVGGVRDAFAGGEFAGCVSDKGFDSAVYEALSAPRPNAHELAEKVRACFGREAFARRLGEALQKLEPTHA